MGQSTILYSRLNRGLIVALGLVMAGCFGGCSKMNSKTPVGQSQVRESRVPSQEQQALSVIGETSEDLYDDAKLEQWKKASGKLNTLQQAKTELEANPIAAEARQQVDQLSQDLGHGIANRNRLMAMDDANQLTKVAIDLGEPNQAAMPKEVSLLDYYGRELEVGAIAKDQAKVNRTKQAIKQTWQVLKPQIAAQKNKPNAATEQARFERLVSQLDQPQSYPVYQQLAVQILDQVDQLEGLFTQG
jgi:hypothetical protein